MRAIISLLFLMLAGFCAPLYAEPLPYEMVLKDSKVVFYYTLLGQQTRGVFPVSKAEISIDLLDVRNSKLDVTIATKSARAGDALMTLAIRGPELLSTQTHPYARFKSTRILAKSSEVTIDGDLTLKGVTRPVSLNAVFLRHAEAPSDNSELILKVGGAISRRDFGVVGFPELVGDTIILQFTVYLLRK